MYMYFLSPPLVGSNMIAITELLSVGLLVMAFRNAGHQSGRGTWRTGTVKY